jgi:citrate lyase subunit beta/citryl-CoA lyase
MTADTREAGGPPLTHLYVPGHRRGVIEKAWASAADAVIVDLEDSVPPAAKEDALAALGEWLSTVRVPAGRELWVRVNPEGDGARDAAAIAAHPNRDAVTGLVLAKASVDDIARLAVQLDAADVAWALSPLIETAEAVVGVHELATAPRVRRLQLGEYDLCADLGLRPDSDDNELGWHRASVVVASAAAGLDPPLGPVSVEIGDLDAFRTSTRRCWRQGFWGRACIHPSQVPVVEEIFLPSSGQVTKARGVLAAFEAHVASGEGAVVGPDGRMVDEATVRRARRTVAIHESRGKIGRPVQAVEAECP